MLRGRGEGLAARVFADHAVEGIALQRQLPRLADHLHHARHRHADGTPGQRLAPIFWWKSSRRTRSLNTSAPPPGSASSPAALSSLKTHSAGFFVSRQKKSISTAV